ncbi:MAG TPA: bile acid:sodium symporter [Oceanipulchritudo sp.]|nr:bile acid:sodium symporter [Oceanipulchritudo sp.]
MRVFRYQLFLCAFLRRNGFIFALLGALLLAFLFPALGADEGPLRAGMLGKAGIMVIFFLQGLSLKTRELAAGIQNLNVHAFIQGWIFLLSPLVLWSAGILLRNMDLPGLAAGFFYLGLLPTTISSAVAFTSAARGNVASAIFNTTFSNMFGVFWVPAGCLLLFSVGGGLQGDLLGPLLLKLAWLILFPLAAGQLLRPLIFRKPVFKAVSPSFKYLNHGIILFIVFTAFCRSVLDNTWEDVSPLSLLLLLGLTLGAVVLIHSGVWLSSGWILADPAERVTALFCASQKTLAAGAPMAMAIFADGAALGQTSLSLILLPLLCYHPLQLFLAAFLLPRVQRPGT